MADKIFADGVSIKTKATIYGEILKVGIKAESFIDFLAKYTNERGYVNLDLKRGQSGKWYMELNTYSKNNQTEETNENLVSFEDEEIPF